MQALSLSLSPAGRGDDKSAFSSAPAGSKEARVPFAEDRNFSERFEATSLKNETDKENPLPVTQNLSDESSTNLSDEHSTNLLGEGTSRRSNEGEIDSSPPLALAPAENQNSPTSLPKGEELSGLSGEKSSAEISPSSTEGGETRTIGMPGVDEIAIPPKDKDVKDEVNGRELQTEQTEIKTQNDANVATDDKKGESAATKVAAELNVNIKLGKTGSGEEADRELPITEKAASLPDTEALSNIKDSTKLVGTDPVENALNKQVDQKAFAQTDFFGAISGGSSQSSLLHTASSGTESNFALTTPLTSPTIVSAVTPSLQMITTNAALAVTNFNAVSQAMLVANETAKGVTVQLDPPEMGRVYIDFNFESDDQVKVVVKSEHPQSHQMLRERSEQFLGFLKESGLENINLSFEQNGQNGASDYTNQESSKPIYLAESSFEDPLILKTPVRTPSNDVQTYDGLDLRL